MAPAFSARAALAAPRPASEVITAAPRSCRRRATPLPISPMAMTAMVSAIVVRPCLVALIQRNPDFRAAARGCP
jgi:hypothetical protein